MEISGVLLFCFRSSLLAFHGTTCAWPQHFFCLFSSIKASLKCTRLSNFDISNCFWGSCFCKQTKGPSGLTAMMSLDKYIQKMVFLFRKIISETRLLWAKISTKENANGSILASHGTTNSNIYGVETPETSLKFWKKLGNFKKVFLVKCKNCITIRRSFSPSNLRFFYDSLILEHPIL